MLMFYLSILETESERTSFTELYLRMNMTCLHVAKKITKNHEMAEDAVHNAFMKIIEISERFFALPCNKQEALTVIIVKNKAIDIVRKERKPEAELDSDKFVDILDVSLDYENAESFERLISLIGELPEIYKTVFELKYLQDLSNGEIAELLDISKNVVGVRLNRAKNKLAEILRKEGVGGER